MTTNADAYNRDEKADLECGHLVLVVAQLLDELVDLGALDGLVGGKLLHALVSHRRTKQHQLENVALEFIY
jgi:hypothetical protein